MSINPIAKVIADTVNDINNGVTFEQSMAKSAKSTEKTIQEVNEAIQNGTLKDYLAKADPDDLAHQLSGDWRNAPYLKILEICDAKIAMPLLANIATGSMLCNWSTVFHVKDALAVFNTSDRLPVFIEALKLGRGKYWNTINIDDLLLRNVNSEGGNPFKGGLPHYVDEAVQIEYKCRPSNISRYADEVIDLKEQIWRKNTSLAKFEAEKTWARLTKEERAAQKEEFDIAKTAELQEYRKDLASENERIINNPSFYADMEYEILMKKCSSEASPLTDADLIKV